MNHAMNAQVPAIHPAYTIVFMLKIFSLHPLWPSLSRLFFAVAWWLNKFNEHIRVNEFAVRSVRLQMVGLCVWARVRAPRTKRQNFVRVNCAVIHCVFRCDAPTGRRALCPRSVVKHLISISGMLNCTNNQPTADPQIHCNLHGFSNLPCIYMPCSFCWTKLTNSTNDGKKISDIFFSPAFVVSVFMCSVWHAADLCIKPCCKGN